MQHFTITACAIAATGSIASASYIDLNFDANPSIVGDAPMMQVLSNGTVLGRALDGSDRVRYSNVGFAGGQSIDAIFTVLDAEKRTAIAFSGGGTTVDSIFNTTNDAVINLSNARQSRFGPDGNLDPETNQPLIAGPAAETQRTKALIRMDLIGAGTLDPIDMGVDIGLTFFDIDGANSGAHRGRVDGLTLIDADSFFLAGNTVLDADTSVPGRVSLNSSLGRVQSQAGELERFSVSALWNDVNSIEFEWYFDWSANGTRGVHFTGSRDAFVPSPGGAAMLAIGAIAIVRRRR